MALSDDNSKLRTLSDSWLQAGVEQGIWREAHLLGGLRFNASPVKDIDVLVFLADEKLELALQSLRGFQQLIGLRVDASFITDQYVQSFSMAHQQALMVAVACEIAPHSKLAQALEPRKHWLHHASVHVWRCYQLWYHLQHLSAPTISVDLRQKIARHQRSRIQVPTFGPLTESELALNSTVSYWLSTFAQELQELTAAAQKSSLALSATDERFRHQYLQHMPLPPIHSLSDWANTLLAAARAKGLR